MTGVPSLPAFEALPFNDDTFYEAIRSQLVARAQVAQHRRCHYLCEYLKFIGAETIVLEHDYVDGPYLDDFAHYYVKSFANYERRCRRLHFFRRKLTREELLPLLIDGGNEGVLQESYLGFVVARPLPQAIVGRTAIATYPPDAGRRHYPVKLDYQANLFGTPLKVRSLAFQEQDTVLAACATVALWSAFHKCAELFGTVTPSPAEITRLANTSDSRGRALPSRSLTLSQMCRAVSSVGLEPEVFNCSASLSLSSLMYGYVQAAIPVVLLADIGGVGHAITINGFSLRSSRQVVREDMIAVSPALHRIGQRIDEFYGHDDQVGPFARLVVKTQGTSGTKNESVVFFEGSWHEQDGKTVLPIEPRHLIVPVYHKIRVTFIDIQRWVTLFNTLVALLAPNFDQYEWDIRLSTVNDFKGDMRRSCPANARERILLGRFPRFLWRATLGPVSQPIVEILFDATDMEPSYQFCDAVFYDDTFRQNLGLVLHDRNPKVEETLSSLLTPQFLTFLRTKTA